MRKTNKHDACVHQLASRCAVLTPTGGKSELLCMNYTLNVGND